MFYGKKFASIEARFSNLESRFNQSQELIATQKAQIESQQQTIQQLITSQIDYSKLAQEVVESLDYSPLTESVQEFVENYEFDYDEIASKLEDSVAERVANDVDWNDVVHTYSSDIVGDDYSKLVQLIADQLDVSDAVENAVENAVNNDLDFDSAITDWLDNNGEELVAQNISSDTIFDAITNDLDVEGCASRDLVESLMTAFSSYNDWRVENGQSPISIGSSSSSIDLESLGEQIKAFIETQTVTSEADAVGDYTALEWQVLMLIRKAVLEILS